MELLYYLFLLGKRKVIESRKLEDLQIRTSQELEEPFSNPFLTTDSENRKYLRFSK